MATVHMTIAMDDTWEFHLLCYEHDAHEEFFHLRKRHNLRVHVIAMLDSFLVH